MRKANIMAATDRSRGTDGTAHFTPAQTARRWGMHTESIRRMLRQRRLDSLIIARRRLIPLAEIVRVETEGHITRAN